MKLETDCQKLDMVLENISVSKIWIEEKKLQKCSPTSIFQLKKIRDILMILKLTLQSDSDLGTF